MLLIQQCAHTSPAVIYFTNIVECKEAQGRCLLLLLRIRSVHLEILGFSYWWCFQTQWYFCAVQNYPLKVDLCKCHWYPKRKYGVTMHFWAIIMLQFEKERHTLLCILKLFTNISHQLSLKNAWLPSIFFLDFNSAC